MERSQRLTFLKNVNPASQQMLGSTNIPGTWLSLWPQMDTAKTTRIQASIAMALSTSCSLVAECPLYTAGGSRAQVTASKRNLCGMVKTSVEQSIQLSRSSQQLWKLSRRAVHLPCEEPQQ